MRRINNRVQQRRRQLHVHLPPSGLGNKDERQIIREHRE